MSNAPRYENSVFINCPFDPEYSPLYEAMIFTVMSLGFHARSSQEIDDGGVREDKIIKIISQCRFGIHDISRTELDEKNDLPRFNMPFELGLDIGCKAYGGKRQATKCRMVLDTEDHRFRIFLSDISGQDPKGHHSDPNTVIRLVRNWLATNFKEHPLQGATMIQNYYSGFKEEIPELCSLLGLDEDELMFRDYVHIVNVWLEQHQ